MTKKILVTGGGGFIGSHLAQKLHTEGNFVRVADVKWDSYIKGKYYSEKITADLREGDNCLRVTKDVDIIYNLAANMGGIGFITTHGANIMHDNTLINTHMISSALKNKAERIFFSSSACVYPRHKQTDANVTPLKEEDAIPADPDDFYGWEKLYTERMLEAYRDDYGLKVRIARFHNIYGPNGTYDGGREKSPAALCRKVAKAGSPGEIEIWGDGRQTRSYCYIDDCVKGIVLLTQSDYDKPLNIGSDRLVTIDELADIIIKISGKKISKKYNLKAAQGVRGRNSDNNKLRQILKWEPEVNLEEGLRRTYEWIASQVCKKP